MTFSEVITDIRRMTRDVVDNRYRQSDAALLSLLNNGQIVIFRRHPEFFLDTSTDGVVTMTAPTDGTDVDDTMSLQPEGKEMILNFVLARIYGSDGAGGDPGKSMKYLQLFENGMQAGA